MGTRVKLEDLRPGDWIRRDGDTSPAEVVTAVSLQSRKTEVTTHLVKVPLATTYPGSVDVEVVPTAPPAVSVHWDGVQQSWLVVVSTDDWKGRRAGLEVVVDDGVVHSTADAGAVSA